LDTLYSGVESSRQYVVRIYTEFIWLGIESSGGFSCLLYWASWFSGQNLSWLVWVLSTCLKLEILVRCVSMNILVYSKPRLKKVTYSFPGLINILYSCRLSYKWSRYR